MNQSEFYRQYSPKQRNNEIISIFAKGLIRYRTELTQSNQSKPIVGIPKEAKETLNTLKKPLHLRPR